MSDRRLDAPVAPWNLHATRGHPARATSMRHVHPMNDDTAPWRALRPVLLAAALFAVSTGPAVAQHLNDRFWFHASGYLAQMETTGRSDFIASNRPGTVLNFEDELGLDERSSLPLFQIGARAGERWRFELEYFALRRSGLRAVAREITWGEAVFPAFASIATDFDSDIVRLSAGYSFLRTDRTEMGAVLGVHATRFRVALTLAAGIGPEVVVGRTEAEKVLVPLPTLGLYATHAFTPQWSVGGRIDYFSLKYREYDGSLVNAAAGLAFRFNDRASVSLGYRYVEYTLDMTTARWRGGVTYRFSGPFAGLNIGF